MEHVVISVGDDEPVAEHFQDRANHEVLINAKRDVTKVRTMVLSNFNTQFFMKGNNREPCGR